MASTARILRTCGFFITSFFRNSMKTATNFKTSGIYIHSAAV
jgi:hypothetical protein